MSFMTCVTGAEGPAGPTERFPALHLIYRRTGGAVFNGISSAFSKSGRCSPGSSPGSFAGAPAGAMAAPGRFLAAIGKLVGPQLFEPGCEQAAGPIVKQAPRICMPEARCELPDDRPETTVMPRGNFAYGGRDAAHVPTREEHFHK